MERLQELLREYHKVIIESATVISPYSVKCYKELISNIETKIIDLYLTK